MTKLKTNITNTNRMPFTFADYTTAEGRKILSTSNITDHYQTVARTRFSGIEPNISVREGFGRGDYEFFRPKEAVPKHKKEIISYCMEAYRRVGIVRNIIDLMGDFCVQGIKIVHPDKTRQRMLRKWAKLVKFKEVSERFANMLFRAGNVVVKRTMAKLPAAEEDRMTSVSAGEKLEPDTLFPQQLSTAKRNIPYSYTFLNPTTLEIIGGELAQFTGEKVVALKISGNLRRQITAPTPDEKALVAALPSYITNAVKQGKQLIPLEQDKLVISHYKKDDWQSWADPMTFAILDDLILLEKMKIADLAALDGAISQVRVWTLGNLDKGLFPSDASIDKLAEILTANPGGGAFDLIWGPDLSVQEYKTDVHHFLGGAKYEPVLRSIYAGLGVPPTLTGEGGASGATNNFVSIQTMIQRLEYVRGKIRDFWEQELHLVQQALGFASPAKIQFDMMTLSDEAAQKKLLIDLWDRNLVSDEAIIETFKEHPDIEQIRQRREAKERAKGSRPDKAGPFFQPEKAHEYMKIALQRGYVNPTDVGLEVDTAEPTPFDKQLKAAEKAKAASGVGGGTKKKGVSGQGRPKTSKDKTKRKTKTFKSRTGASYEERVERFSDFMTKNIWARESQRDIAEVVNPIMLKYYNKSNLRELSETEAASVEKVRFTVLANLIPYENITEDRIVGLIKDKCKLSSKAKMLYDKLNSRAFDINGRDTTMEERKLIQASVYALMN